MARQGMDVDAIRNDGTQMKDVGENGIPQTLSAVEGIISQMHGTWHGADSEAFVNAWNSTYKPNLTAIAAAVAQQGQAALANVQQQEATSSATQV